MLLFYLPCFRYQFREKVPGITVAICLLLLLSACNAPVSPVSAPANTPISVTSPSRTMIRTVAAANGVVYLTTSDATLSARQASDGHLLWSQKIPLNAASQYITTAGNILVVALNEGTFAVIEALQGSDGHLLWQHQTSQLAPVPLLSDSSVVYVGTAGGLISAYSASDGRMLWKYNSGQVGPMDSFLYANEGIAAILSSNQMVHVLHAQDGSQVLLYQNAVSGNWWPSIGDGEIVAHSRYDMLQAFRTTDGSLLWSALDSSWSNDSLAVDQGGVYLVADGGIKALSDQNGSFLWQKSVGGSTIAGPVIQNQLVYVMTQDGAVTAFHTSNGSVAWERQFPHFQPGSVSVDLYVSGVLLFGPDKSTIDAWRGSDGKDLWHYKASASVLWEPQTANGLLFVWKFDGTMDVLRISDGNVLWRYLL